MNRQIELPDVVVFVVLAATFAVGYFLPITADPRIGYAIGWLAAIIGFVVVETHFLGHTGDPE